MCGLYESLQRKLLTIKTDAFWKFLSHSPLMNVLPLLSAFLLLGVVRYKVSASFQFGVTTRFCVSVRLTVASYFNVVLFNFAQSN